MTSFPPFERTGFPASLGGFTLLPSGLSNLRSEVCTSPLSISIPWGTYISGPGGYCSSGFLGTLSPHRLLSAYNNVNLALNFFISALKRLVFNI
jgi:hypothetical protein